MNDNESVHRDVKRQKLLHDNDSLNEKKSSNIINQYDGFLIPSSQGKNIEELHINGTDSSINAETFFNKFIAKRKPCILRNYVQEKSELSSLCKWRNLSYMKKYAGESKVYVEKRNNISDSFGKARYEGEVQLQFATFLDKIQKREIDANLYYLTTQPSEVDEYDRAVLMSSPLRELQTDFPSRLSLAGGLIPSSYNIWMGMTPDGSTSGLHHDYHDNFYCLINGRKVFKLFSPADAESLGTRGKITKVYSNGRICYDGDPPVGADGVLEYDRSIWSAQKLKADAESELLVAEADVKAGKDGAEERLAIAEENLQDALDRVLDAEIGGTGGEEIDDDDDDDEEYDDDGLGKEMDDDSDEDDCIHNANNKHSCTSDPLPEIENDDIEERNESQVESMKNFCISTDNISGLSQSEVEITSGDVLYLPAGWFHEVTSYSNDAKCNTAAKIESDTTNPNHSNFHLAFNYWFHPPDSRQFQMPYKSVYWHDEWRKRMKESES